MRMEHREDSPFRRDRGQPVEIRQECPPSVIDELWTVRRWSERYPDQQVSVTHGFPWRAFVEGDGFGRFDQFFAAQPPSPPTARGR